MTHTPAKPKRRRWRWVVAGTLFLLLSGFVLGWTRQSASDPRFVGTWDVVDSDDRGGRIALWSNGYGGDVDSSGNIVNRFHWNCRDEVFSRSQNAGGHPLVAQLTAIAWKRFGGPAGWSADVISATPDKIHLRWRYNPALVDEILTRVSE